MSELYGQCLLGIIVILLNQGTIHATRSENHHRLKREIECDAKYREITVGHSACRQPSNKVQAAGVSDEDKKTILDAHNNARRSVSPPAKNMMLMTWDDEIANTAQRWAENCVSGHEQSNYQRYAFEADKQSRQSSTGGCKIILKNFHTSMVASKEYEVRLAEYKNNISRQTTQNRGCPLQVVWNGLSCKLFAEPAIIRARCIQSTGRFSVGQNAATGQASWTMAMKAWEDEKNDYDYATNRSPTGKPVGHYTQMVWANSSKIGCGYALCDNHYYVCNYGPAGNSNGDSPYMSGDTCSMCSNMCTNKLCDCNGVVCLNGGEIDYDTCTCKCKSNLPFYLAPTCGLKCENSEQAPWCGQYPDSACEIASNVPQECPYKCNWCPTAAYKPGEDTTVSPRPTDQTDRTESSTPIATDKPTTTAAAHTTFASAFISLFVVIIPILAL